MIPNAVPPLRIWISILYLFGSWQNAHLRFIYSIIWIFQNIKYDLISISVMILIKKHQRQSEKSTNSLKILSSITTNGTTLLFQSWKIKNTNFNLKISDTLEITGIRSLTIRIANEPAIQQWDGSMGVRRDPIAPLEFSCWPILNATAK